MPRRLRRLNPLDGEVEHAFALHRLVVGLAQTVEMARASNFNVEVLGSHDGGGGRALARKG